MSALEEEELAITSIYGPASFYAIPSQTAASLLQASGHLEEQQQQPVVYTLKVSLEEPDFDADPLAETARVGFEQLSIGQAAAAAAGAGAIPTQRKELELRVFFPAGYPDQVTEPPVHEIVSIYYGAIRITASMVDEINRGLAETYEPGEVVIFNWIEWLRSWLEEVEQRDDMQQQTEDDENGGDSKTNVHGSTSGGNSGQERTMSEAGTEGTLVDEEWEGKTVSVYNDGLSNDDHGSSPRISGHHVFQIKTGQPIVDRKSVFIAHLAAIDQPGQVPLMIQQLKLENKKVIKATHNIMAYRVQNPNGSMAQDNDDDGETAAGSRLLHLMSILDVKNVVVVVSRWYGGIQLGADRFKHINNAARQLLEEEGYVHQQGKQTSTDAKPKGGGRKSGKR